MENIIQSTGGDFNVVYCHNDEMALGAVLALKAAGMNPGTDVKIIAIDGPRRKPLRPSSPARSNAIATCSPRFGPASFDAMEAYLAGEELPQYIINEETLITIDKRRGAAAAGVLIRNRENQLSATSSMALGVADTYTQRQGRGERKSGQNGKYSGNDRHYQDFPRRRRPGSCGFLCARRRSTRIDGRERRRKIDPDEDPHGRIWQGRREDRIRWQ